MGIYMEIVHVTECLAGGVLTFLVNFTHAFYDDTHIIIYGKRAYTPDHVEKLFGSNVTLVFWEDATQKIQPYKDIIAFKELIYLLHNYKGADIIQLHSSKAGFLGRVACRVLGMISKTVYIPHGISFARQDISYNKALFYIVLERFANRLGGQVVACSHSEGQLCLNKGIKNVSVISNGIASSNYFFQKQGPLKPIIIGTSGRITLQKNPALFLDIASHFYHNPYVKFLWIGDGEMHTILDGAENIAVTGWLSHQKHKNELQNIDIYLSTASWEGLPYAVLEAMSLGKPLILSQCIGNIDLVKPEQNGFSYRTANQASNEIRFFMHHPEQITVMGSQSHKMVQTEFSLKNMKDKYMKLYHRVLSIDNTSQY